MRGIGVADMASRCAASPLACRRVTLGDPEAVLLVDNGKAEGLERDVVLEQGVGADGHLRRAGFEIGELGGSRSAPLSAAGQEHALHPASRERPCKGLEVLARQDLRRRHQHRLQTRRSHVDHRQHATTVLPAPTSPCSSRVIRWPDARSPRISASASVCAPVRRKGSAAWA